MSLNWKLTDIKDWEELWEPANIEGDPQATQLNSRTESLIWATMNVGINRITKDNAAEFYRRYVAASFVLSGKWKPYLTLADVERHVGLATNADTLTRTAFEKNLLWTLRNEAEQVLREQVEQAERESV